jgi:ADP-ribose pyrophosphatase YjhB (NUDIX family)
MYKFFINDKPLLLTSSAEIPARFQHLEQIHYQTQLNLMDLVRKAEEPNHTGIALICEDPAAVFQKLKSNFTSIHAGGGIVFNEAGKLLLMKRLGKWDLPKGKIDPGETAEEGALREVEEECGLNQLSINHFFDNSYHTYKIKGHRFLKVTHWYVMNTLFNGELVPQLEENITEVKWEDFSSIQLSDFDTYESIREILFQLREKQG